jgi:hypothetical protein
VVWPTPRFTDKGDGTVNDNLTGLTWSKHANAPSRALPGDLPNSCLNAEKDMIWLDAFDFIACLNAKNHAGSINWRLPNLNELESMVNLDFVDSSAYLNSSGFGFPGLLLTHVKSSQYWTATSDSSDTAIQSAAAAWEVDLAKGGSFSTIKNELKRGVWPVRDGASSGPAQLRQTGQSGCFDDLGDTRPCATMGEDGEKQAGAVWPASRFQVNAGTSFALDRMSGIIWTTSTQTPGPAACADTGLNLDWQQALDHVACLNNNAYLGRSDWRLPNRKELQSLTDYSKGAPALPDGHPFSDNVGKTYWSSTTDAAVPRNARVVSMFDGTLSSAVKAGTLPAWPVSGPDLTPPPPPTITQGNMSTKVASQTISGTVDLGATVQVSVNGAPIATGVNVNGVSWIAVAQLAAVTNTITVTATDISENMSGPALITITLDTAAPSLAIHPASTSPKTNKKNRTIDGTVDAGAIVTVKMGVTTLPFTLNDTGTIWSTTVSGLIAGANNVTINAADAVGNVATQTAIITFIVPDGIITGGSVASIKDALKGLRILVGLDTATADDLLHGDVAPLGAPDDKIDLSDVLLVLRKVVGLASF